MPGSFKQFRPKKAFSLLAFVILLAVFQPANTHAQGCTQCRDNTAASPPATQRAYRHAIELMAAAATTFFVVTLILFKRNP